MKLNVPFFALFTLLTLLFFSCEADKLAQMDEAEQVPTDSITPQAPEEPEELTAADIDITKDFTFEDYLLDDSYPYKDTVRTIKWDQIREKIAYVESLEEEIGQWGVIQNYRNSNGEAPTVEDYHRNDYGRVADKYDVERYQSAPLYVDGDTARVLRYGRDGWLTHVVDSVGSFYRIAPIHYTGEYFMIPKRYLRPLGEGIAFHHVIVVDRGDQNIVTLERIARGQWVARSTNPATTGLKRPPHQMETPLGVFLLQEKKEKMYFVVDGTSRIGGFAPWASRFHNGGYIHGIPVNKPRTQPIEYSQTLGTTPRSHMCVRNATSHAKFIFDWAPTDQSLVIVIE